MCFAPQRRALFRHHNFQKCCEREVFLAFSLANALRATTACNFSSLIWPASSAPAALASLLFEPPEPQIIGKTQCFATVLPFRAPGCSFFWDFLFLIFFLLLFSSLLFSSLLFSDSSHLCFSSAHIVGSLTSKLPSISFHTLTIGGGFYRSHLSPFVAEFPNPADYYDFINCRSHNHDSIHWNYIGHGEY